MEVHEGHCTHTFTAKAARSLLFQSRGRHLQPSVTPVCPRPASQALRRPPRRPAQRLFAERRCARAEAEQLGAATKQWPASLYYMKQTIGNACGTIGMLHAFGNNRNRSLFGTGLPLVLVGSCGLCSVLVNL